MKWSPAFLSSKPGRWVLVVRSGGVRLFRGSRRAPGLIRDFAADESGYAALGRYLEHTAAPPIHLLVDVVEEDFRRETVPHVFGRTRQGVLATRSGRLFHGTPYVSTRREGRAPEGRRDDRILFSAIVRPERIEPWLDVLREHEAPVAGIHSLPITSARLLPLLGANAGQVLLVTESGERDLRQTFFEDGRLALSRLAPLPPGKSGDRARCIVAEVERFLHHLDRSGHSTEGLKIRFVGGAHLLAAMRALEIGGELAEGLVDTATVERRLGHRCRAGNNESDGGSDGGCDRMFARLALSRRPPNHYAPAAALAIHRSKQAARALKASGIAMLLAGAALERIRVAPLLRARRGRGDPGSRSAWLRVPLPGGTAAGVEGRGTRCPARGRDGATSRHQPGPRPPDPPNDQRSALRISRSAIGEPRMVRDLRP